MKKTLTVIALCLAVFSANSFAKDNSNNTNNQQVTKQNNKEKNNKNDSKSRKTPEERWKKFHEGGVKVGEFNFELP